MRATKETKLLTQAGKIVPEHREFTEDHGGIPARLGDLGDDAETNGVAMHAQAGESARLPRAVTRGGLLKAAAAGVAAIAGAELVRGTGVASAATNDNTFTATGPGDVGFNAGRSYAVSYGFTLGVSGTGSWAGVAGYSVKSGVYGNSVSSGDYGVAAGDTGVAGEGDKIGVHGTVHQSDGIGVKGDAHLYALNSIGVQGSGDSVGVQGIGQQAQSTGVWGETFATISDLPAAAVAGYSLTSGEGGNLPGSGVGVYGTSGSGIGVLGSSDSMAGVRGEGGTSGTGVVGAGSTGVAGSGDAIGVLGQGGLGRGGVFSVDLPEHLPEARTADHDVVGKGGTGAAQLRLVPSTSHVHPKTGEPGDLFVDSKHRLWYCYGKGWKQLA